MATTTDFGLPGALPERDRLALRRWLLASIIAVFFAVAVGGITRLTESGLSITEWKPVSGALPPSSDAAWALELEKFRQIPQASTTHAGITLAQFKWIYWWEWFHRNVARTVGLVFAIPYLVFLVQGRLPKALRLRLTALPLLTAGQGALGWYMVQSGLVERISVSAYRLTAHLGLALGILAVAVWTYSELRARTAEELQEGTRTSPAWRLALVSATTLLAITVLSGGFVAGLRGGKVFNEFPLMGGQVVPPGYATLTPWWSNAFENPAAAQFHHRVLALTVTALVLTLAWRTRQASLPQSVKRAVAGFATVVTVQLVLGVTTLLLAVPIPLGVLHQFTGVLALTAALVATQRAVATVGEIPAERRIGERQTADGRNYLVQTGVVQ
ncbi:COX15/CtaA family protein [Gemmatimonas sp.]|uniref:COX15/CtaA family protein n=1 Tax=Gemmatimonas sp. TaxID=1962908 RepID=UPI0022BF8126|nr:COX15/CtaA family protein [Gemmatimonas sp.]MCZ8206357.1 COX15/CtaA family protein [Gemmatimonas sp.]